jgi:uncharacterized MnhB-related membrane protein
MIVLTVVFCAVGALVAVIFAVFDAPDITIFLGTNVPGACK